MSELKTIAKNTSMLAMPKVFKFLVGIVSTKIVAVFLGPEGSGIISQIQNILMNVSVFANGGLTDGMVKQISKANSENVKKEEIKKIIKTYAVTIASTTFIVFLLGFIFSEQLTQYVFGNKIYHTLFLIGFLGLPILILSSSSFAILKAYKKFKTLMYADVVIIILNFITFFALLYYYKMTGAVIQITISYIVAFFVYRYFAEKEILKKLGISFISIVRTDFALKYFKELLTFFSISIIVGATSVIMDISTRSIVVTQLGIDKIGIYGPIIAWAGLFTSFILPSLGIYLFPRLSEVKSNNEITGVINDVFRLMTFILVPFVLIAIPLRTFLVPLFYSKDFIEASTYLPFHFIGLFFSIWNYIFIQTFIPTGRIKKYFPIAIFQNLFDFSIVFFLVPVFGLWGWVARFTISPLIMVLVYYYFWHNTIHFKFSKENYILIVYVLASGLLSLIFRNNIIVNITISFLFLILLWFIMNKKERIFLLSKLTFFKSFRN